MVNVLLAASPATRSRPRAIKGQEPGLVDVLLQPTEQTRSRRKAEVVNELLWVAAKRTFTSPGSWPLITKKLSGVSAAIAGGTVASVLAASILLDGRSQPPVVVRDRAGLSEEVEGLGGEGGFFRLVYMMEGNDSSGVYDGGNDVAMMARTE